jgi:AcrR family transcriptional regulator
VISTSHRQMADKQNQLSGKGTAMNWRQRDKRFRRTQSWIVQAFNELVFKRAYSSLRTDSKRAGVGRSTFYEHFRDKDEVLVHSTSWIPAALACIM